MAEDVEQGGDLTGRGIRAFGGRPWRLVVRGLLRWRALYGVIAAPFVLREWRDFLRRYLFGHGGYPASFAVRTPLGARELSVYSHADVLTIMVCFIRRDYAVSSKSRFRILDLGANIGISAAYFLTRHPANEVYCVEPLSQNCERLKLNLRGLEERYRLLPVGVADFSGVATFGIDSTGVFSGIGHSSPEQRELPCVHVDELIDRMTTELGPVDLIKIDIEGYEERVARAIAPEHRFSLQLVFLEAAPEDPVFGPEFRQRQRDAVCVITRASRTRGTPSR